MQTILLYVFLAGILFTGAKSLSLLEAHNKYRKIEGVPLMRYDETIAQNAAKYASKCIFGHSAYSERQNIASYSSVGENLFLGTGNPNLEDVVSNWYKEKSDYNRSNLSCTPGKQCGHYTQVIWSKSTALGCGTQRCASIEAGGIIFENALYVVCQYGPAGNYAGQSPFQSISRRRGPSAAAALIRKIADQLQSETEKSNGIGEAEDHDENVVELTDEPLSPPKQIPSLDSTMVL
ncbi:peptidase inhibitor 16-like [Mizuhopecten yessoensis]|uniref:Peptidase inhibitor 16 n=1 Tax=Mizuhopecten yessoensis TaxID=6573 RepID=A0A210Q8N1_MIZYE|nr:peptidase inhibitor 16-like [Mizuhopecten yessoensis]OWF45110.1 Peptidase inhibitor 16 [Mizuhopecten yessoensis]